METTNLADLYHLDPIPWSRALKALESFGGPEHRAFLATTRPDGRPHLAGVGALWDQGKVYIVSGEETRKSRNLAGNRACAVSMSLPEMDLVVEGRAEVDIGLAHGVEPARSLQVHELVDLPAQR